MTQTHGKPIHKVNIYKECKFTRFWRSGLCYKTYNDAMVKGCKCPEITADGWGPTDAYCVIDGEFVLIYQPPVNAITEVHYDPVKVKSRGYKTIYCYGHFTIDVPLNDEEKKVAKLLSHMAIIGDSDTYDECFKSALKEL